jgi:hypothetical protein
MSQCSKCSKVRKFLSLLINCFPFVREFRLRKKIRYKRLKMQCSLSKDEPKHLRRYILQSGTIRRL